jgi:hypothetical protein
MTQRRIEFEHGSRAVAFAKPKRRPVPLDLRDWSRVVLAHAQRRIEIRQAGKNT